jgi:hypothetical protein
MENKNMIQTEKECKACKNKKTPEKLLKTNWWVFAVGFYILFTSVYGTIQLIKGINSFLH